MGALILALSLPVAIGTGIRVRQEDALAWHAWVHAAAVGFVAFGMRWLAGYGLVGLIFFPIGVLVGLADAYFKLFDWLVGWL